MPELDADGDELRDNELLSVIDGVGEGVAVNEAEDVLLPK